MISSPKLALIYVKLDSAEIVAVMNETVISDSRSWYVMEGSPDSSSVNTLQRTCVVVVEIGTDLQP